MTLPGVGAVLLVGSVLAGSAGLVTTLAEDHGVPKRAAEAYLTAARNAPCPLDYRILVAIGATESGHGTTGGAHINEDGKLTKAIVSSAAAKGPMQFIDSTWAQYATDGDGDGVKDINDIDDSATSAAALLCASNVDDNLTEAVGSYNGGAGWRAYAESRNYVKQVDERMAALPADDGSTVAAGQAKLPDDEGRLCGVGEWLPEQGDCLSEARMKAAYLWARFGQLLDKGDTERLHAVWTRLNGDTPATGRQVSASTPVTVKAAKLVEVAKGWVGRQFNVGQREQCAYWVRTALKEAGLNVGVTKQALDGYQAYEGTANGWGPDQGTVIKDQAQVRPGDIVMFGGTYGGYPATDITHVGIAVGDGNIVDRPTASAPVGMRPMSDFAHFVGAVRLGALA